MVSFRFTINSSFLTYSTHPITVPKTQVDYKEIEKEGYKQADLTIIFPKGERARGHMYYGVAGYGPYYQIRSYADQELPKYLSRGDKVFVSVYNDTNGRYAAIEYRD